jgi:hypothetical protein
MKLTRIILALAIIFLGLVHIGFTPVFYPGMRIDSMWFAGTGLALALLGLVNCLLIGRTECWAKISGAVANFAALTLLVMIAITIREAHAWFGAILALGLFIMGIVGAGDQCCTSSCCCHKDEAKPE